ncbi:AraC family transcriptional regulator [Staphylococcus xylosus]|uniref:AraC family transcriptional regulator n=1 Tax=Staphylococcus xylosus TaxID=1288 RepID=A0AAQ0RXU3_STAXY|nr:AraC family transcriptional regulator [Staphylococcus xylosus]MCE7785332.1 AraC family transcriptional regulator [Staphylococcus xylosus]PTH99451.1 AraC family transcriptional regulator [Staphylococcus xylosus]PTI55085.1 AraC family transcriptional regulator [Staphylococcus xylosus]PTI55735.1 AraC family transcriptional regulator [Staphylococcus xylosus]RIM66659.1 AraC family transcriptional regulator [Staphylococcus xylosus]
MQVLWKKFQKKLIDANLAECGIEIGVPNVGYNYTVFQKSVLHIVTQGEGTFSYAGETYHLTAGDIFLLERGMEVEYKPSFSNPWTYYWVGMNGKQILNYLSRCSIVDSHVILGQDTTDIKNIIQLICKLSQSIESNNSNDILIMQYLYQLVYTLQEKFPKIFSVQVDIVNEDIQHAVDFINTNYQKHITVEDVAKSVNVTRSHLYKLFKKNLGCSPKEYLTYIRMYHASQLLIHTSTLISDISRQVGYKDPLLFSKNFTKHFEISASEYRHHFSINNKQ